MVQFFILAFSIFVLSYLPGRIILSFTKFTFEEKFAASFAVSFFLYFLFSFITFLSPLSSPALNSIFLAILISVLLIICFRHRPSISKQEINLVLLFFSGYLLIVSIQSLLPYYTGGGWTYDWLEHFQRSIFFLDKNLANPFFGKYLLTARPPLFNLVASFFLTFFSRDFYVFQIVSTLLNFSAVLPCFLICRYLIRKNPASNLFLFILAIFILNPAFVKQITYTWTKAASAYFLLLGIYFYLQNRSNYRLFTFITAFIFLALSYLTHYSAGPYILLIFLYLFFQVYTRHPGGDLVRLGLPRGVKSVRLLTRIIIAIFCFLIICLPWYSWSISRFGLYQTFLGNTAYQWQEGMSIKERTVMTVNNLSHTLIPALPQDYLSITNNNPGVVSQIYDRSMAIYSTTLPGNLTFTLCIVLIIYLLRIVYSSMQGLRLPGGSPKGLSCKEFPRGVKSAKPFMQKFLPIDLFWPYFIVLGVIFGAMVVGDEMLLGYAHVTLLPISLLLVCFAIKVLAQIIQSGKRFLTLLIICFLVLESVIGTGSMIYATNVEITQKNLERLNYISYGVINTHWENVILKNNNHLVFLADQYSHLQPVFVVILAFGWLTLISILAPRGCTS